MLNILAFLLDLIDQHVIWFYVALFLLALFYLRAYLAAHRDRTNTVFTIEKEVAAHREGQAMSAIGVILGLAAIITAIKFYLIPTIAVDELVKATPTLTIYIPTREPATPTPPTPTAAPVTPTTRPRPTQPVVVNTPVPPTATAAPAAHCPDPNVRITSPGMGAVVSGRVAIRGTANHDRFQFYKVELAQGENPSAWHVINDVHRSPVVDGVIEEFASAAVPNGVYWLRLTVVDETGNFPAPCQVRIVVQN